MHFRSRSLSVVGDNPDVSIRETVRGFPGHLACVRARIAPTTCYISYWPTPALAYMRRAGRLWGDKPPAAAYPHHDSISGHRSASLLMTASGVASA